MVILIRSNQYRFKSIANNNAYLECCITYCSHSKHSGHTNNTIQIAKLVPCQGYNLVLP